MKHHSLVEISVFFKKINIHLLSFQHRNKRNINTLSNIDTLLQRETPNLNSLKELLGHY